VSAVAPERLALWPLRLFLGFTFSYAGLQKLANPDYLNAHSPTSVQATILSLRHSSPIGWLLGLSGHAPVLVGVLIALGELAVGLATLVGLFVRLTAAGGLLLSLTFFLTVSFHTRPYYYGSDIVFLFAWTVPLLAGRWPEPSLDGWIRRRSRQAMDPSRRALVLGGAGAATLGVAGGLLAGMTAVIGRARHHSGSGGAQVAAPTRSKSPATRSTAPKRRHRAAPGRRIAAAADVPTGSAVSFTDDQGGPAWLVHEADGSFHAFSAVCTHAGCTVSVNGSNFVCPCHGGAYSVTTGAVLAGPPPRPLSPLRVEVVNGDVRLL
jgi:thiosulfate dehydrogenase [quinone] large subunit